MSVLRIYGDSISGNCLKVKWVAERLRRPFEWIEVDISKGESRTPQFLAMNPAGQVPAVVLESGRSLAQSNAIMLHLAEGTDLIPADPFDRAKMFEWLFWEQYTHEPAIAVARFRVLYMKTAPEELDPALVKKGLAALERMEQGLQDRLYLAGEALSLADVALVAYTRVAHEGGFDLAPYPALREWITRIEGELRLK